VAGVDCAVADGLTDDELEARLYRPALARSSYQLALESLAAPCRWRSVRAKG
jgi:hypothetical protein